MEESSHTMASSLPHSYASQPTIDNSTTLKEILSATCIDWVDMSKPTQLFYIFRGQVKGFFRELAPCNRQSI